MNGSEESLTFAGWLGPSYGECLARGIAACTGFEGKEQLLLPARAKHTKTGVFLTSQSWVFLGSGSLSLEAVRVRTTLLSAFWRWLCLQMIAGLKATCVPRVQHHVLSTLSCETNALTTPNQNFFCFSSTGWKESLGFPGGKIPTENIGALFSFRLMNVVTLSL